MERIAVGTLLFGPGERLTDLRVLVQASAPRASVRQLEDLDELVERRDDEGILLIDADILPAEDVGYLRRFLARQGEFRLTLVGEDSSRRVARSLLRLPRVQWLGWPPDLDDVRHLVGLDQATSRATARTPRHSVATQGAGARAPSRAAVEQASAPEIADPVDELARIEAILDLPDEPDLPEPPALDEPIERETPESRGSHSGSPSGSDSTSPPAYFKDQVADLADIAQRIEGGVASLREPGATEGGDVEALAGDVSRLVQFTRTLSYLSAAPPRGDQVFDLSELVETLVAGLPKKGPQAPRWMARSSGPLPVSSDRELLMQAFDALLFVAEKCSVRGEVVRVQAAETKVAGPRRAIVTVEFSAGPLAEFEPHQVIEPYAIRRVLPDLGPNALSAARGIVVGQGGRLELSKSGRGRLTWILEMPIAPTPATAPTVGPERRRAATSGATVSGAAVTGQAPAGDSGPAHPSRGAADPFA